MTLARNSRVSLVAAMLAFLLSGCSVQTRNRPAFVASTTGVDGAGPAKNVILFIGDGMGISTVTAARIYDGQSRGEAGEENLLSFERFPNVALVKTYNSNQQVPDSAGTASAMNLGVKTRAGVIGIGPTAQRGDCLGAQRAMVRNIAEQVHRGGKAVGIVTTMRITHATPAAVYAHSPERDWEGDADIPATERAMGCLDIAKQLIAFPFEAALGGGQARFLGGRKGGKRLSSDDDLIADWMERTGGQYVTTAAGLSQAVGRSGPLLGLFAPSHMKYMLERKPDTTEPTLSQMTSAAIAKLARRGSGYFLMIEGGNIDHGHHEGRADIALSETQELARAVQVALAKVSLKNTLILVTADHSHVFTISGYPQRGNPILGLAMGVDNRGEPTGRPILAMDGRPYTTLGYQNGPGAVRAEPRPSPSGEAGELKQALVPTGNVFDGGVSLAETHSGEDVALYAIGPGSSEAHGVIEQSGIFDIMMKAFGITLRR